MNGTLRRVTSGADLGVEEVVERYRALADIERGFEVSESEIEIGPVRRRLPDRIRAHASVCFLAVILHRLMRAKLRGARGALSLGRTIGLLGRIENHQVSSALGSTRA